MPIRNEASRALGQIFIMGFSGLELGQETAAFIKEANIGGVVLFSHNYENPGQVAELINQIQECRTDLPLWISVDQEGGRVQRFKKGFTRIPDAASIGLMDSPKLAYEISELIASELKAVGINVNFCPVADITTNPKNPVVGNRAYGHTEAIVSKFCTAVVRGHINHGIQPCVKHFPGHGDTNTDSHFALPKVSTTPEVLSEREFKPFLKAFKSGCNMVMTAHILANHLDSKFPATLSKTILQGILREQLRFEKLIISDDMEMKAITDHFGLEEAPRLAVEAGCDHLIYRSEAATRFAYQSLQKAIENGQIDPNVILQAAQRIRLLKTSCLIPYLPITISELRHKLDTPDAQTLVQKVENKRNHKLL